MSQRGLEQRDRLDAPFLADDAVTSSEVPVTVSDETTENLQAAE